MLKNVIKVLLSNFITTFISLLNSFVFPVIMSVESYSAYHEFTLYVSYVNICHLGIASGMFLYYGGQRYQDIDRARYKSEISLILLVLGCFSAVGFCAAGLMRSPLAFQVALAVYPVCMIASLKSLYQAWNRFTAYSVINVVTTAALTFFLLAVYFVKGSVSADMIIGIYLAIQYAVFFYFMAEYFFFVRGVKALPLFSRENRETAKVGFLIMAGNYIMLLFHALDKQFVIALYSAYSFAMYSFAASAVNIMNIFVTAMATPFYPKLAQKSLSREQMNTLKELLFVFGAYSGCAYFAVSFIVRHFIDKYVGSLGVVYLFFAAFPATAVIHVLYVNLYKVTKQVRKYIFTLVGIVVLAFVLNSAAVLVKGDYVGIAAATLCTYYIWLFYSQRDFEDVVIGRKDVFYLLLFLGLYFLCIQIRNEIVGFFVYGIMVTVIDFLFYRKSSLEALCMVRDRLFPRRKGRG